MTSWKAWALVAVIFLTGVCAGAFGMRAYILRHLPEMLARPAERFEDRILSHIDAEVGLTDAQRAELRPLIKAGLERGGALQESVRPAMDANFKQLDDAIAEKLDAAQKVKFAELRARMEKFRRSMPPGPPHGPPPGPPPGGMTGPPPGPPPGGMPPGPPPN
ncbi:MAG: hypothetical protein RDU24_00300 [Humidesulfovibrio sp.]|uniref:hypothetical protein n=1 Tax=Humidesulfovibrio sp. TaxID=2910988 RepID=UPI0027FC1C0C|nr:hypothetical protein [Humidesulfovibrio sp.]MDQ7833801.1 hypothetical protein [Humidesulfovibrio sp.]